MALARCRDVELLPPDWNIGNSYGNLSGYTGLKKYFKYRQKTCLQSLLQNVFANAVTMYQKQQFYIKRDK